jgi:hypothetical protein
MSKRSSSFLLVLLLLAPTALARVISYAPYTDQAAVRGYHQRTTRHFILMEGPATHVHEDGVDGGRLVLYDSTGVEEPRVIYPATGVASINFAALWQPDPNRPPAILINVYEALGPQLPANTVMTKISTDGGATWRRIVELDGRFPQNRTDLDFGGPWTRGLGVPVRTGNAAYPFIVAYAANGVYAIPPTGSPVLLASTGDQHENTLVAQNREGTFFVVRPTRDKLALVDLTGKQTPLGDADVNARYSGWITSDGSVYLQRTRSDGRFLSLYRNGQRTFIAGPYNIADPTAPPALYRDTNSFFAVPTHDFNGAWILQRERSRPTTLSRHIAGGTLEQMWSDISGPEVEALHAGSSGERLLIQVHRERPVTQIAFIDPALAIWKVGQPAPREYDELFLNEGPLKGFVNLDVEKMAAGEPFVFDSGFIMSVPDIIVSPPISGGGDVIQEWGVVRASLKQRLVLPGVARLPGAFNSYWQTDVILYNPLDEKQDVTVQFVALGEEIQIAATQSVTVTLEPLQIRVIADALKTLFNIDNGGGAFYLSPAHGINANARTYTKGPNGGSFGFGMMAIDFWNAAGPRFPLSFAGAFPGSNFRTNILLTDTSGRGSEARLQAYGVSGTIGAEDVAVAAPTNGVSQTNFLGGMLGLFPNQAGGLVVQPTRGTAIPAVVAIDNRTNDPTYFPPDLPASIVRAIPVIGHVDGANGSRFRSDVYLLNLSPSTRTVTLEVKDWNTNEFPRRLNFTLLPNEARVIEDALFKLFNMQGLARLRYWSDGVAGDASGVRVTSRTYTIEANGATYGCLIPPLNNFQSATAGESLEITGIVGGSGFRTNLGLVELSPNPDNSTSNVRITIFDDKGKQIDRFTVALARAGGMQINDIFGARGVTPPPAARIVVQVLDTNGGLIGAYATLTDNVTNDSTFLGANLGANPD